MIRLRSEPVEIGPILWKGRQVWLHGSATSLRLQTRWFGMGVVYRRPTRVVTDGPAGAALAVRDPVMLTRVAVIGLTVAALWVRMLR